MRESISEGNPRMRITGGQVSQLKGIETVFVYGVVPGEGYGRV